MATSSRRNEYQSLLNIRTVTGFLTLKPDDFREGESSSIEEKISSASRLIGKVQSALQQEGYTVQTLRLATNPFGEWLSMGDSVKFENELKRLDACLGENGIGAFSLGSAETPDEVDKCCARIVATSRRFYCSAAMGPVDTSMARAAARCVRDIAAHEAVGNFQFCAAASVKNNLIPFFPASKSTAGVSRDGLTFAVGLENGRLARDLLKKARSIEHINSVFRDGMAEALAPIQDICQRAASQETALTYAGMDTSLNPSLDPEGSVANALEQLVEVPRFAGPGTLAAAATLTRCLQTLPGIHLSGYCGLMLPLCEDVRLAELAGEGLRIADLLSISHVCGVGVDTVPIDGDAKEEDLALLILDVAAIAHRWGKSLSCRVFPVPGRKAGDMTCFDSPHMVNASILQLTH